LEWKNMLIIPAIDLKDGQCVRLRQGLMEDSTVFGNDPVAFAKQWVDKGCRRLHLVDLNGAFAGEPVNGDVVTDIAQAFPDLPIQIGGGIRSGETIEHYLRAGVNYVIIGTKAVKEPDFVTDMCQQFPGHIIVGLDAKDGLVATDGWADVSELKAQAHQGICGAITGRAIYEGTLDVRDAQSWCDGNT
jgi:phosphoribosylformimino-5-aminoimidazole carboxamide ribotide isomerase